MQEEKSQEVREQDRRAHEVARRTSRRQAVRALDNEAFKTFFSRKLPELHKFSPALSYTERHNYIERKNEEYRAKIASYSEEEQQEVGLFDAECTQRWISLLSQEVCINSIIYKIN
jgi:hypothetical protein